MIKKNIYKWHRTCSLIIAIPVLLWAISGFMHPVMTNIRPKVATQFIPSIAIDSNKIKVPLQTALTENKIDSFQLFRMIHIDTNWFYQIKLEHQDELVYLSTQTGKLLKKGDWIYAQYLARYFLEGENTTAKVNKDDKVSNVNTATDCCDAATACVLKPTHGTKITTVNLLKVFDDEYKSINKVLPVYKVVFERNDRIRIYVETIQDRFAFAVDRKRAVFNRVFAWFHTWEWLNFLGKGRVFVELFFVGLAFLTALMGIYIFFITKTKKANGNCLVKARKNHRITSIIIVLFTLMFTFSGFYHATTKLHQELYNVKVEQRFITSAILFDFTAIQHTVQQPISNINLIKLNNNIYWRVTVKGKDSFRKKEKKPKDLMKEMSVPPPTVVYINTADFSILKDGEKQYAHFLANRFGNYQEQDIVSDTIITAFAGEYGFINKRLPVWRVNYKGSQQQRFYVETSTGTLAASINDDDLKEAYSFNFLHKHHFMDFAGKEWRDFSTMFWAAAQIVMVVFGLTLYFKTERKQ